MLPYDSDILDWLEKRHTLHWSVEFLYVVDGYQCSIHHNDRQLEEFHGETLREAIAKAMKEYP